MAIASASLALFLLMLLHLIRKDLDPLSHMISEYALGRHGWILLAWFLSLALACIAVFVLLMRRIVTVPGKVGLGFLALGALGAVLGGILPMDSLDTPPELATASGRIHGLAGMVGMTGLVLAAIIIGLSLRKREPWVPLRVPLMVLTHLTWVADALMACTMIVSFDDPHLIGLFNRMLVLGFTGWLIVVAWPFARSEAASG